MNHLKTILSLEEFIALFIAFFFGKSGHEKKQKGKTPKVNGCDNIVRL